MTPTYRDATPTDIPALDALFRGSFSETFGPLYAPADLAAFLAQFTPEAWTQDLATKRLRLAEAASRLLGYAKLGPCALPVEAGGDALELYQLYLAADAKGTGVARTLMDWTIATSRSEGATELYLSVYVENHRARRFYERYGFLDIGRYDFPVGDHIDEDRLMRLTL